MHLTFANLTLASCLMLVICSLEFDVGDPEIWLESTVPGPTAQRRRRNRRKGTGKERIRKWGVRKEKEGRKGWRER